MGGDALVWAAGLAGVAVAAFVKGAIGFGYPLIATPLLAFATDVRTAVAVLVIPNILMDVAQMIRRPGLVAALRRHAPLLAAGIVGTVVGTQFLAALSTRALLLTLGVTLLVFVVLSVSPARLAHRAGIGAPARAGGRPPGGHARRNHQRPLGGADSLLLRGSACQRPSSCAPSRPPSSSSSWRSSAPCGRSG